MPTLSSSSSKTRKYSEQNLSNFNRAQFFFNPSHIQPQTDRRCLQRLHIENSFAKLNSFVLFSCEEEKLPESFKEFYNELIHFEIDSAHSYQLIINSLTYYYSNFGYTLEPLLRNICDRLNLRVKLYRSSDSLQDVSTKRKSSMTSSNQESHTSSIEPNNSFSDEEINEEEEEDGNYEDEMTKPIG
uniref:Uncharacterized protein n=1 Tax=Meloidogyne hapla TaxID=6305 RepID=A0A1I8B803_MELHA